MVSMLKRECIWIYKTTHINEAVPEDLIDEMLRLFVIRYEENIKLNHRELNQVLGFLKTDLKFNNVDHWVTEGLPRTANSDLLKRVPARLSAHRHRTNLEHMIQAQNLHTKKIDRLRQKAEENV